ncbi:LLM class F420-dependent oxidoreductase, partial [Actinomadura rupiterrae]|uniref:LLM class F420-dependent oxidoreductase n=1 Tax=Actinomadura rupiterrae TaxID=559627 RepID=UPI0020A44148
ERTLGEAFPGRYLLGLGGHRIGDAGSLDGYAMPAVGRAVPTMRAYLDAMDAVPAHAPVAPEPARRVLAALGPKMLELAGRRTWGAHPYFVPVEHTERARQIMGPEAFLGVEQAVVLDSDRTRARDAARAHVRGYVEMAEHQRASLRRLGFDDHDMTAGPAGGPTDRVVDAIVAHGDVEDIRERVHQHLQAGADHVCVQVLTDDPSALPLPQWRTLAPALL